MSDRRDELRELIARIVSDARSGSKMPFVEQIAKEEISASTPPHPSDQKLKLLLERLADPKITLEVDKVIAQRAATGRPRMDRFPIETSRRVARRMIEVAYYASEEKKRQAAGTIAADFAALCAKAQDAAAALRSLIDHLQPRATSSEDLILPLLTSLPNIGSLDANQIHDQARQRAEIIWKSRDITKLLQKSASAKRQLIQKNRKRDEDKHHTAFAEPVVEAWVHLTSAEPSKATAGSPFILFLQAAWEDAYGGSAPKFVGAVRTLSGSHPNRYTLLHSGPWWL